MLFPTFLQFKSEFGNKELVHDLSYSQLLVCSCWLYRASQSLAAKNIISLILVLTIWWGPSGVVSYVVGSGCLLWPVRSLGKSLEAEERPVKIKLNVLAGPCSLRRLCSDGEVVSSPASVGFWWLPATLAAPQAVDMLSLRPYHSSCHHTCLCLFLRDQS